MYKKIILLTLIYVLFLTSGCEKNVSPTSEAENNRKYYEVKSYLDKGNGWVYYMNLVYDKNFKIAYYNFNGINKKIENIENLYMPVTENGIEIERWKPLCICLNYYQTYKEEFDSINNFFNQKKFQKEINIEDLKGLDLQYYSKKDLVYLFNQALKIDYKRSLGKFENPLNSLSMADEDGEWTIVTEGCSQYIELVFIDYKYNNGKYLSDLASENKEYSNRYSKIKLIEKYIIENQEVKNISNKIDNVDAEEFSVLFKLLSKIDTNQQ